MALTLTYKGKEALPVTAVTGYQMWSYQLSGSSGELQAQERVALALPADLDIRNPALYPDVSQLSGTFVERSDGASRQYAGRTVTTPGSVMITFVAPTADSTCESLLVKAPSGQGWVSQPFKTTGTPSHSQVVPAPKRGPLVFGGRPLLEFRGTLPYSSELMGIYQPLVGWLGAQSTMRLAPEYTDSSLEHFSQEAARDLSDASLAAIAERFEALKGVLSPVGLVNLFRQYFFEFDTFLGSPSGHVWLSPGSMVELIETSTRRTLVERTAEQSEETTRKTEETLTEQDDVADAVKEDNANETKLGVSVTGGVATPIYHADASASFSTGSTIKKSSEESHKRSRTQSAKVSSEIKRNYKTTFKTATETTDTSSRRYVLKNDSSELVNYELRRKMRKIGVQLQHVGSRLCWQIYLPDPGRELGLGDMVHTVTAPDLTSLKKPEPPAALEPKITESTGNFPVLKYPGTKDPPNEENADFVFLSPTGPAGVGPADLLSYDRSRHIIAEFPFTADPPASGYKLSSVAVKSAQSGGKPCKFVANEIKVEDAKLGRFRVIAQSLNVGDMNTIQLTFSLTWAPPDTDPAQTEYDKELNAHNEKLAQLQRESYANAIRDRLQLVSSMRPRLADDLRSEERHAVYGQLIGKLTPFFNDPYFGSEMIRQTFEVDEMLYFVAPDYWRPRPSHTPPNKNTIGKYPVPKSPWAPEQSVDGECWVNQLSGTTVAGWYSVTDKAPDPEKRPDATCTLSPEWRVNYLITDETQPAPLGSSLDWRIQIDGDERRNAFLNASWVKAVLPIRPGHEEDAINWLAQTVEGQAAFGKPYPFQQGDPPEYQGLTVGEVLKKLAQKLKADNTEIKYTLASEEVFETGFDPLTGGFRPADPYQIFDQWIEILPTDQVAAVQVKYDPKTGQQL
jgi:hypothetical protein